MNEDKAICLGHPSYVWGFGQERRRELIRRHAPLENRIILDVGCGLGMYVRAFRRYSQYVHGVDIDADKVAEASRELPNIQVAPAEVLPYPSGTFDVVLLHEVIEHVTSDRQAIDEAVRVLRDPTPAESTTPLQGGCMQAPGGRLILFAPNRLYPFETHGAYWGGQYHFGNVPFLGYLPNRWRARFCPHVRAYTVRDMRRLLIGQPVKIVFHTQIYPGYDKLVRRHRSLGSLARAITYLLEHTPLRILGLSHFLVAEKTGP
jgi:SAM-dependent methyltransferase